MNIDQYIEAHIDREPDYLYKIDRLTNLRLLNGRMCSGHTQGRLLKMLTSMIAPKRVLELGTFSGYSALCMAEALDDDASLDTIEVDDELEDFIRANLAASPHGHKIRLHIGDASELMNQWAPGEFDLIFMDADKRAYPLYYEKTLPLLRPGGYIIADNTLWDGHVTEVNPRAPQTLGIMRFNDMVAADNRVEKVIIPLRDGLTIIRRIP
ncbi:MAG: O-methyltransferase [Bacteroides sp.]|nr:O-methyltransferase [Bacteroides sp.]MDE6077156.1 O-methyltransferase [Muribaculaceae bacterium]MDE6421837.1 O-methyltransferase [Muribaculaceae bacterium]